MTLTLLLLLAVPSPSPSPAAGGQRAFEAAISREAGGDFAGAAAELEALARRLPDDSFADDALFEAAVLAEERLSDPARAAKLYGEVATRYPQSRLSRRARTRAEFLGSSLRTGAGPLAEYQRIQAEGARDPKAAIAAMAKLLSEHPDFALADRALYWLGARLVEQGRDAEGVEKLLEVERRFPSGEWALRAKKARADLLLKRGKRSEARQLYDQLFRSSDAIARAAGKEGLAAVHTAVVRGTVAAVAIAYLAIFVGFHLFTGRRRLRRTPTELLYYLPVAGLFTVAGITENSAIGWATGGMAAGGAVITWVMGAATPERPVSVAERAARALALAVAVAALAFVAIQWSGLTDLVIETFRAGPER
jgi:TolA-binding protein